MKVVLDTDVIIAAFAVRGLCKDLFEYCLKETDIYTSQVLLDEICKNLSKKIRLSQSSINQIRTFLQEQSHCLDPVKLKTSICRDSSDVHVLVTAKAAKVDFIITGDHDLLVIKEFEEIKILSPREFWQVISKRRNT